MKKIRGLDGKDFACPKCGTALVGVCYTTIPTKYKIECPECGWQYEHNKSTNADRIRSMSDEELADELLEWFAVFMAVEWTKENIIDWLKKEAT